MHMIGAIINAIGIVAGGVTALIARKPIPVRLQSALRTSLGAALVWYGIKLTWTSINGTGRQMFQQFLIVLLAMALGQVAGKILHLQKLSNRVGQFATWQLDSPPSDPPFSTGFVLGTALFCVGPLALLGSVQEGLGALSQALVVKALIDGLTAMSFVATFGWSVIATAIPVLALEGALIRITDVATLWLRQSPYPLIDSIAATDGMLILCVGFLILEVRKIAVTDYFPSLVLAPLFTWLIHK